MRDKPSSRGSWGSPKAFRDLAVFLVVLGALIAFDSKVLDVWLGLVQVGLLVAGSLVLFWRTWKHRAEGRVFLGQHNALPRSWRKWMLGESDDDLSR